MTMKKTTYKAIAPDGQEFTRKTFRTYTHAVIVRWNDDCGFRCAGKNSVQFCGTRDLAEKAARTAAWCATKRDFVNGRYRVTESKEFGKATIVDAVVV